MDHYLGFSLSGLPDSLAADNQPEGPDRAELFIVFRPGTGENAAPDAARDYLLKVLSAIGYDAEQPNYRFLALPPGSKLDLTPLLRRSEARQVILFGIPPRELGIHFRLHPYRAERAAGITWLWSDDLVQIRDERAAGNAQRASALWQALKTHFATD
ncbi:MAG: hypothetical protein WBA17_08385 [Saprospiraceae bacterium]